MPKRSKTSSNRILLKEGFVTRTASGRRATAAAYRHLGIVARHAARRSGCSNVAMRASFSSARGQRRCLSPALARAQSDADPAQSSSRARRCACCSATAMPRRSRRTCSTFDGRSYRGTFARTRRRADRQRRRSRSSISTASSRARCRRAGRPRRSQAQAICARTYVLQRSDPRRQYDLVPSELDQVYDGIGGETPAADSGGRRDRRPGALRSADASRRSRIRRAAAGTPNRRPTPGAPRRFRIWRASSARGARRRRTIAGRRTSPLDDDRAALAAYARAARSAARRAHHRARSRAAARARFELITDRGNASVPGSAFRRAVGTRVLPSLLLDRLERDADGTQIAIDGGGLGHGVGLCQWGARGMALAASAAPEILAVLLSGNGIVTNLSALRTDGGVRLRAARRADRAAVRAAPRCAAA